ncbi:hypothetical protein R3P38DRAFT_3250686 [Favolaschia claudopus]|uniref:Transmembrane protein n=1 Tax=Favolaschia claudopus TaxID=2862362 RepID=A0AAW0EA64_9AGAR
MASLVSPIDLTTSAVSFATAAAAAVFSSVTNPAIFDTDAVWAGGAATDQVIPTLLPSSSPTSRYLVLNHTPDTGVHDFVVYFVIIMGFILASCVYILGKHRLMRWRASQNDDEDEEKRICAAFTFMSPEIPFPPRRAPLTRADLLWLERQQPAYISQADILLGRGRGFFG